MRRKCVNLFGTPWTETISSSSSSRYFFLDFPVSRFNSFRRPSLSRGVLPRQLPHLRRLPDCPRVPNLRTFKLGERHYGNVTKLNGVLPPEGSVYKPTKLNVTWLPEINELAPLTLVEFGYLLKKKKLDKNEDFVDVVNRDSKKEIAAVGDSNMRELKCGDILQLERKGYFRCDVLFSPSKPIVLYAILDGRQK
ncbi:glutamate--tRNA ligase, cytoplasmic [Tanacetum coccineum]